jgi:hypothetical protein
MNLGRSAKAYYVFAFALGAFAGLVIARPARAGEPEVVQPHEHRAISLEQP